FRDRIADRGLYGRGAGVKGDRKAHALRAVVETTAAVGISRGKVRRARPYADGKHRGDGRRALACAAVRETFAGNRRRNGVCGGLFYFVEAGDCGSAGVAFFLFHVATPCDFV